MRHKYNNDGLHPIGPYVVNRQDGTAGCGDNRIDAAAMCQDGSVVLAGVGGNDSHVIKLDDGGGLLWHFQV